MVTNSSVFDSKNTDFNENRGPRRQSATRDNMKSSYSCSVMMMMMERGVAPLFIPKSLRHGFN